MGWVDLSGTLIALLYSLPTLGYRFGRDQAIVDYAARALLDGYVPYSDGSVAVVRTPNIFYVFALADGIFGPEEWAIRVVELGGLLVVALLIRNLVWDVHERRDGCYAAALLCLCACYVTTFDYWDTAQQELWEALFLLGATLVASRTARLSLAAVAAAGFLGAVAFMFKYPAGLAVCGICVICLVRRWRERQDRWLGLLRTIGSFGLGALLGIALSVAPFLAAGEFRTMWEVIVEYVLYYTRNEPAQLALPSGMWLSHTAWLSGGCALIMLAGAATVLRTHPPYTRRAGLTAFVGALAFGSVVVQRMYFGYHFGVVVPFVATIVIFSLRSWAPRPRRVAAMALLFTAFAFASQPRWLSNPQMSYPLYTFSFWRHLSGRESTDQFLSAFKGGYSFDYRTQLVIGQWLERHAKPGATLCVDLPFDPLFYTTSGLRCSSRFPILQGFTFKNGKWAKEHAEALKSGPPTYVVRDASANAPSYGRYRLGLRHAQYSVWVLERARSQ